MELLSCGHAARAADVGACPHLVGEEPPDYYRLLRGRGLEYDVLCRSCADGDDAGSALGVVCEGCVARLEEWDQPLAWRGQPEVRHRDAPVDGSWALRDCPAQPVNARCVAPLPHGWLVLTADGLVDVPATGEVRRIGAVDVVAEPANTRAGPALHTSPDGRYAAVVNDYGSHGSVVDVGDGSVVLRLDRGSYHAERTPFPVAFLPHDPVVVAATEWNRLDAFHLPSGRLTTDRDTTRPEGGPPRPHYLDYFHGALHLSPSGHRLVDDGWVWHPVGVPSVVDVAAWLGGDVHGAEHLESLSFRYYAWDQPMAWLDERTVAVQRIGWDDEAMIDGVELYDAVTARRTGVFAGPAGRMWAHAGRLYVATPAGLEIWDPVDGARAGRLEGFRPVAHDPRTGTFAEIAESRLRTWTPS